MVLSQVMVLNHMGKESDPIGEQYMNLLEHIIILYFFSPRSLWYFFYEIMVFTYCSALIHIQFNYITIFHISIIDLARKYKKIK